MDSLLYRCDCPAPSPAGQKTSLPAQDQIAIDLHCHLVTPQVARLVAGRPEMATFQEQMRRVIGERSMRANIAMERGVAELSANVDLRLREMDRFGIAIQVLSPAPGQYHYWADETLAATLCDVQNAHIADICARWPDRFLAFGAIALQHPKTAIRQMRACMAAGFKGVEISSNIAGRDLSDPAFAEFWSAAAELGAVVFIHPLGSTLGDRLDTHYLSNIIGQPLETTIALSKLIVAGLWDRLPGIKVLAAHGGGYLPNYAGRLDHAYQVRPEARTCSLPPSDYLGRPWYDTVVHSPDVLASLIARVGIDRVVVGSDFPYDMGEYRLESLLDGIPGLDAHGRESILRENARSLLGLD